jgi:hypothetical protein
MPYSITTKDGITIRNIPDDIDPNSDILRQRVAKERSGGQQQAPQLQQPQPQQAEEEQGFLGGLQEFGSNALETAQDIGKQVVGGAETAATFVSGAVADPLAGLAGIAQSVNPFADEGAGAEAVKGVKEALSFKPRTEAGKAQLQAIGGALEPVGKALSKAERFLGEKVLEKTDNAALAAIAHSLPTAALEILGLKGSRALTKVRGPSSSLIKKTLIESAPEMEAIKTASRGIFKELDESGVAIKNSSAKRLEARLDAVAAKQGIDKRVTSEAAGAIDAVKESIAKGEAIPTSEMDTLRTIAKNSIVASDPNKARVGMAVVDEIDNFLDNIKSADINPGAKINAAEVGKKYKSARQLWGRAKRSEMLTDAIEMGASRKAGVEKGIRNELNNLLNRKKSRKFLSKEDVAAIRKVTDGDFKQNFASLVGGMGLKLENSPSMFGSLIGGGGVGALTSSIPGLAGAAAPIAVGAITVGTISKQIANKLARNSAAFLDATTRAGTNGRKITQAYLKTVPKNKRSVSDLSDLLLDPKVDLRALETIANETVRDAVKAALFKRELLQATTALSAGQLPSEDIKLDFTISGGQK